MSVWPALPGLLSQPQKNMYFGQNEPLFKLVTLWARADHAPALHIKQQFGHHQK